MNKTSKILIMVTLLLLFVVIGLFAETVSVKITTNPSGAYFFVGQSTRMRGPTPLKYKFRRGSTYVLTFTKDGYEKKTITYKCNGQSINVTLTKKGGGSSTDGTVDQNATGKLIVNSNMSRSKVYINNSYYGDTPLSVVLKIGSYQVRVQKSGAGTFSQNVTITTGRSVTVNATLTNLSKNLTVTSNINSCDVYINGSSYGTTPLTVQLPSGNYTVLVKKSGFASYSRTVTISNSDVTINATLSSISHKLTVTCNINNAKVFIDNNYSGETPFTTMLPGGTYKIKVKKESYGAYVQNITIVNSDIVVNATLHPQLGKLKVTSNIQGAKVFINGNQSGTTPTTIPLSPGEYSVLVTFPGLRNYATSVNITAGKTEQLYANLMTPLVIKIKLPKGTKLWIEGLKQSLGWGKRENWKVFTVKLPESIEVMAEGDHVYNVMIKYGILKYNKMLDFYSESEANSKKPYTLSLCIKGPYTGEGDYDSANPYGMAQ